MITSNGSSVLQVEFFQDLDNLSNYSFFMKRLFASILFLPLILIACNEQEPGQADIPENYEQHIDEWKAERVNSLKEPTGWMRLAGMYWLDEGKKSFGSGSDQDIRFPEGTIPGHAGYFHLQNGEVRIISADGVELTHNGQPIGEKVIYDGEEALEIEHNSLLWHIIERADLIGIRLYNKENEKVDRFTGFESYPVDPEWRREAIFVPYPDGSTISIANILGQQEDVNSPGYIKFTINGETYTLDAIESTEQMFIIVGDESNKTETYQAGRYMYIDYPEEGSNRTVIDFNKAYNPPCSYSQFTTCQLPPPQNRLDVEITAGELRPVGWDGI